MKNDIMKKNNGITLITLVITIIILTYVELSISKSFKSITYLFDLQEIQKKNIWV